MKQISDIINKFINSSKAKIFAGKYPRLSQFIFHRFSLNKFSGLPLTSLIIVFLANLFLFNEITENIKNAEWLLAIDNSFAQFLFVIRNKFWVNFLYLFSKFGSYPLIIPISLVSIYIFFIQKRYIYIITLFITLTGTGLTTLLSKIYFQRVRPLDYSFYNEYSYSFPSGHAMIAIAFYGLLFYIFIRHSKKHRMTMTIISLAFILLLGFSRLYLGVHYLSDVCAGYSLGFSWLLLSISIVEYRPGLKNM